MFGYATDETPELMPLPIALAHRLARRLSAVRKDGSVPYLRPDGKTQVTVVYEDDQPVAVDTVVVSSQHAEDISIEQLLTPDIKELVVEPELAALGLPTDGYRLLVNPTGKFVIGGPMGDAGLTGRKIIVDTYGGMARHGGGAFSGKDPSKVDRSGAYAMRWVAKNVVAAGLARRCEVQVAYAIGAAHPVGLFVETFGTGTVADDVLEKAITTVFDLRPGAIVRDLDLLRPDLRADRRLRALRPHRRRPALGAAGPRRRAARGRGRLKHWTPPLHHSRARGEPAGRRAAGGPGRRRRAPGPPGPAVRLRGAGQVRRHRAGRLPGAGAVQRPAGGRRSSCELDDATDFTGKLLPLSHVPSGEPVLTPQVARLARAVADRYAGHDERRPAAGPAAPPRAPPRSGRRRPPTRCPSRPTRPASRRYPAGPALLTALAEGRPARAVWTALPGRGLADPAGRAVPGGAVRTAGARWSSSPTARTSTGSRRPRPAAAGALVHRAARRRLPGEALPAVPGRLAGRRPGGPRHPGGDVRAGPRPRPGGHLGRRRRPARRRPRAPYPHARDVLVQRAWLDNCAAVVAGHAAHRRGRAAGRVRLGARAGRRPRRRCAPPRPGCRRSGDDFELARDPAARSARLPVAGARGRPPGAGRGRAGAGAGAAPGLRAVAGLRPLPGPGPLRALRRPAGHLAAPGPGRHADPGLPLVRPAGGDLRLPALPRHQAARRRRGGVPHGRGARPGLPRGRRPHVRQHLRGARHGARRARRSSSPPRAPSRWPRAGTAPRCCSTPGRCWAGPTCGRGRRRCAAGSTRPRWCGPRRAGGQVVVAADAGHPVVQALVRWDPAWLAERELADRRELGLPAGHPDRQPRRRPRPRWRSSSRRCGCPRAPTCSGPVPEPPRPGQEGERERYLVRVPRAEGLALAHALTEVQGVRSAKKVAEHVRVQLDPLDLV